MRLLGLSASFGLFVSLATATTQKRAVPEGFVTTDGQAFELDGEPFVSPDFLGEPLTSQVLLSITWAPMPTLAISLDGYGCRMLTYMTVAWPPNLSYRCRRDLSDYGRRWDQGRAHLGRHPLKSVIIDIEY